MKRIYVFAKRCFRETLRDPLSLVFLFAVPVAMLILFYLAFSKLTSQFEIEALAPSMCGFAASFIGLFTGLILAEDRSTAFLSRLYTTPIRSHEFIIGYLVSMLPFGCLQSLLLFLTATILEPSFFSPAILFAVLGNLLISILFISFGILIGSLCSSKSVGGASSILIMGQSMLSGMWFPLDAMDKKFVRFLNVLPFKNASDLMTRLCSGDRDFGKPLLILLGYTAVTLTAAVLVYRQKMKKR